MAYRVTHGLAVGLASPHMEFNLFSTEKSFSENYNATHL